MIPNTHKRQRTSRHASQNLDHSSSLILVCLVAITIFLACPISIVHCKEVEATSEWTLLGENDTVAAGMHVRMDLTTGEKWVKTIDDNDDESNANANANTGETSSSGMVISNAHVDANGNVVQVEEEEVSKKKDNNGDEEEEAWEPNYNYEAMHRTLSNLPEEEQARIGGIPELPEASADSKLTPEQRVAFEKRMKEIWEARQAELKAFQEDHLADLPKLLKDRIASMKAYLQNPMSHLQALDVAAAAEMDNLVGEEEVPAEAFGDILFVLQDLEYHLTDVDMARDFYTLGGWPILSSLLTDAVHEKVSPTVSNNNSTTQQQDEKSLSEDDWNKINLLQAHAAWAIGTAVKNTGEFSPYATVQVEVVHDEADEVVKTTALDLVLAQFVASSKAVLQYASTDQPKDDYYDTVMMKVHKTLYALGSLLRGNRQAQTHFCADEGPALLAKVLSNVADQVDQSDLPTLPKDMMKIAQRLLSLAQDIVMDVTLHSSKSEQVDVAIGNAFSSPEWCSATLRFLPIPRLYETTLSTVQQLAPRCVSSAGWDPELVTQQIQQPPPNVKDAWLPEDLDMDLRKERLELVQSTVEAVQQAQKQ